MHSSARDSSVWRSLAVAFGDGLAFGVGMKISQSTAARQSAQSAAAPELAPVAERLAQLEEQIRQIERKPHAIGAPAPAAAKLDQQVLAAVVGAVEERLQEQSAQAERRLSEQESRVAQDLDGVHEQVRTLGGGTSALMKEMEAAVQRELQLLRREVSEALQAAGQRSSLAIEQAVAVAPAEVESRLRQELAAVRNELALAVDERVERGIAAGLAGELSEMKREVDFLRAEAAELRGSAAASEQRLAVVIDATARELGGVAGAIAALRENLGVSSAQVSAVVASVRSESASALAQVEQDLAAAQERAAGLEGRLAELPRAIDAQVSAAMDGRLAEAERSTLAQVREATHRMAGMLVEAAEASIAQRVLPLEAALMEKDAAIAAVDARSRRGQREVLDVLAAIGRTCQMAAGQAVVVEPAPLARPEAPAVAASDEHSAPPPGPRVSAASDDPAPAVEEPGAPAAAAADGSCAPPPGPRVSAASDDPGPAVEEPEAPAVAASDEHSATQPEPQAAAAPHDPGPAVERPESPAAAASDGSSATPSERQAAAALRDPAPMVEEAESPAAAASDGSSATPPEPQAAAALRDPAPAVEAPPESSAAAWAGQPSAAAQSPSPLSVVAPATATPAGRKPVEPAAASAANGAADSDVPPFAQTQTPRRVWRIPLVSSFLLATGGWLLAHYR